MSTAAALRSTSGASSHRLQRTALHVFLGATAAIWLLPPLWAIYTSLRPYADTAERGYVSLPGTLNFQNYINAWTQADLPHYYGNTLIVVAPALVLTLLLSSFVAFVIARFPFGLNLALLMVSPPATCCRSRPSLHRSIAFIWRCPCLNG
jgi:multiple sugar transport system permease protein